MLTTARGTQALIDLEDRAPDVLTAAVSGSPVPLWPQVRSAFAAALNVRDFHVSPVTSESTSRTNAWLGLARACVPSRWDAASARGKRDLLFLAGGTTTHAAARGERNWLVGSYAEAHAREAAIVQWAPIAGNQARPAFVPTWSLDPASTRAAGFAKLSRRDPTPETREILEELFAEFADEFDATAQASIVAGAVYHERVRPHVAASFERLLDRLEPKVVLMEDASYGAWSSLIVGMRARGIVVAEPQHGWIGPTHAAYNFGGAMFDAPLRAGLPDALLTFGPAWADGLRYPGDLVPIGKPHLEEAVAGRSVPPGERNEVLVVSSTTDPDQMQRFVLDLRALLDARFRVIFRPHPSERLVVADRYPALVAANGVEIDDRADVYDALGAARAVVGVASTVLFEAPAFGCHVFVRDSPLTAHYVGTRFGPVIDGHASLAAAVRELTRDGRAATHEGEASGGLWSPGATSAFERWLREARAPSSAQPPPTPNP